MELIKFDHMKKTWHEIARNHPGDVPADFELQVYRKLLDIFHVGRYYYYIVNIAKVEMEFVSDEIREVLGLSDPYDFSVEYVFEHIHPDDQRRFALYEHHVTDFFSKLPPDKVLKYKVSYDFRLRRADGEYLWILMQTVTIQSNDEGAVIRVLGVQTDISHLKTDNRPSGLSFIGLDGEPSYHNVDINHSLFQPTISIFSKRELQILKLMVNGLNSMEIANQLFISKHTVDSHRKQIMHKSGCRTNVELGSRAVIEGWI